MYIDVATLVREALVESGCDESIMGDFDGHSTISLDFDEYPSLLISAIDERIWLWSRICEDSGNILQYKGVDILDKILKGCSFSMTGQLQISTNDDFIELRGLVHPSYLESSTRLAEAMDEFFVLQEDFLEIIR